MNKQVFTKGLAAAMVLGLAGTSAGCKKDDTPSNNDILIGEWNIVELEDLILPDSEVYSGSFEFEEDGNLEFCTSYEYETYSATYCLQGQWTWANDEQDELNMVISNDTGQPDTVVLDIDEINENRIEGQLEGDGYSYDIILEKID